MGNAEHEAAIHNLNSRGATICDKCERRKQCYEEGRLHVYTLLSDYAYEEAYGYKGCHGILQLGEHCPITRKGHTK